MRVNFGIRRLRRLDTQSSQKGNKNDNSTVEKAIFQYFHWGYNSNKKRVFFHAPQHFGKMTKQAGNGAKIFDTYVS